VLLFRDSRHVVCVERNRVHEPSPPVPPPSEQDIRRAFNLTGAGLVEPAVSLSPSSCVEPKVVEPHEVKLPQMYTQLDPVVGDKAGGEVIPDVARADGVEDQPSDDEAEPDIAVSDEEAPIPPPAPPGVRRGSHERCPNPRYANAAVIPPPIVPVSFAEVMTCPDAILWMGACNKEINTLLWKGTFQYICALPPGRKVLKGMFIFTLKVDGAYKARLVVKGCAQRLGQDYDKTFSPVARSAALCLVVSVAVLCGDDRY
jgi:hypothetical protein